MTGERRVLLVAGEPSGDRMAAGIARALSTRGVTCVGMGGDACARTGVRLVADIRGSAVMGFTEVARSVPAVLRAYARLVDVARSERPHAAILVDYAEFNEHLGRRLRRLGVRVLRCVAPQVWAWRSGRLKAKRRGFDRLAVILPFEEPLWRDAGVDAHYVGHPSLDAPARLRSEARAALGIREDRVAVALLPGSREHEVRRLAPSMLAAWTAFERTRATAEVRLFVAASLEDRTRRWLVSRAASAGVRCIEVSADRGAGEWLAAFDASLAASGTATLESALAGAPPVIVYRVSALTAFLARRLLRVPWIGLPNVILRTCAYPELLQDAVGSDEITLALRGILDDSSGFDALRLELRRKLEARSLDTRTSAERMASLVHDWIGVKSFRDGRDVFSGGPPA